MSWIITILDDHRVIQRYINQPGYHSSAVNYSALSDRLQAQVDEIRAEGKPAYAYRYGSGYRITAKSDLYQKLLVIGK